MALQKSVTTKQGFLSESAYHRVEQISLPSKSTVQFMVSSYKSLTNTVSFDGDTHSCAYDMTGANPMAQAYTYLKTLPEFVDATDV